MQDRIVADNVPLASSNSTANHAMAQPWLRLLSDAILL